MKLLEFISYCKLCGIIVREAKLDDVHKLVIRRDDIHAELLYDCKTLEVRKCHLSFKGMRHPNPDIHNIIHAILPNEIS